MALEELMKQKTGTLSLKLAWLGYPIEAACVNNNDSK